MEPQLRTPIIVKRDRRQWFVFLALLLINGLLAFIAPAFGLQGELLAGQEMPPELANIPGWVLGLANTGMIVVVYGIAGAIGLWLGQKAGLPGVFRVGAGWRAWVGSRPIVSPPTVLVAHKGQWLVTNWTPNWSPSVGGPDQIYEPLQNLPPQSVQPFPNIAL